MVIAFLGISRMRLCARDRGGSFGVRHGKTSSPQLYNYHVLIQALTSSVLIGSLHRSVSLALSVSLVARRGKDMPFELNPS